MNIFRHTLSFRHYPSVNLSLHMLSTDITQPMNFYEIIYLELVDNL